MTCLCSGYTFTSSNEEQKIPIEQPLMFHLFKDNCKPSSMEQHLSQSSDWRVEHREWSQGKIIAQIARQSMFKGFFSLSNQSSSILHLIGILKLGYRNKCYGCNKILFFLKKSLTIYIKLFSIFIWIFTFYILCSLFYLLIR